MAWEIAKGILIAFAILFVALPIGLALLYSIGVVTVSSISMLFKELPRVKELPRAVKRSMNNPAILKLTSSSKGWVLPLTNGQAALVLLLVVGVVALLVLFGAS